MKIKYLIPLCFSVLSAFSCENKTKPTVEKPKDDITAVSICTFGGMSTIQSETYLITKDSVKYSLVAIDSTKNIINAKLNTKEKWERLLNGINLNQFKSLKDGESRQAYDGNDTKITIAIGHQSFSKLNADSNQSWDKIRKIISEIYREK